MNIPPIAHAVVVSQDPDHYAVNVSIIGGFGGQMPAFPVKVASHGPRDAVRGHFPELPQVGNSGIVVFPRGDARNGVWIGSFEPTFNDASPHADGTVGLSYHAAYSGGWSWHGPDGTTAMVLPDGTSFLAGSTLPIPTRHTLDEQQARQRTPFTAAQRRPDTPGPLPLTISHASGTNIVLAAGGGVVLTLAGGAVITAAADGTITLKATTVTVQGDVHATGQVIAQFGGSFNTLNHHTHPGVSAPTPNT